MMEVAEISIERLAGPCGNLVETSQTGEEVWRPDVVLRLVAASEEWLRKVIASYRRFEMLRNDATRTLVQTGATEQMVVVVRYRQRLYLCPLQLPSYEIEAQLVPLGV